MVCASQSRFACSCARISSSQGWPSSHAAIVASTPVTPGEPSRRAGMRAKKRAFSAGRAEMHHRAAQRGDVEALGRRGDGDGARGDLGRERRQRDVRVAGIDDVGVDFVGHHDQVVADGERRHLFELRPGEGAPRRVLRMAEDQHAGARIGCGFVGGEIEHPACAVVAHRVGDQAAAGVVDRGHERRIGRQLQQHRVAWVAERHHRGEAGLHQIADRVGVGGIGLPAEAALHAAGERGGQRTFARGVAVFLVAGETGQRLGDRRRDAEIHVGDPGGQHVVGELVPLVGAARPQGRDVEVGHRTGHVVRTSDLPRGGPYLAHAASSSWPGFLGFHLG